eukprot:3548528-Ditylum_brightwellii.AAC.1
MAISGPTTEQGFGKMMTAPMVVDQAGLMTTAVPMVALQAGMEDQDQKEEYGVMGKSKTHTFVSSANVLNNSNIFVGDTGATSDTTNLKCGCFDVKKATKTNSIVDASGHDLAGSVVGDIKGTICTKED